MRICIESGIQSGIIGNHGFSISSPRQGNEISCVCTFCLALTGVNLAKNLEIVQMVNDLEGEEVWGDWEMHHPALAARDWCDSGAGTHFHLLHCVHIANQGLG